MIGCVENSSRIETVNHTDLMVRRHRNTFPCEVLTGERLAAATSSRSIAGAVVVSETLLLNSPFVKQPFGDADIYYRDRAEMEAAFQDTCNDVFAMWQAEYPAGRVLLCDSSGMKQDKHNADNRAAISLHVLVRGAGYYRQCADVPLLPDMDPMVVNIRRQASTLVFLLLALIVHMQPPKHATHRHQQTGGRNQPGTAAQVRTRAGRYAETRCDSPLRYHAATGRWVSENAL